MQSERSLVSVFAFRRARSSKRSRDERTRQEARRVRRAVKRREEEEPRKRIRTEQEIGTTERVEIATRFIAEKHP